MHSFLHRWRGLAAGACLAAEGQAPAAEPVRRRAVLGMGAALASSGCALRPAQENPLTGAEPVALPDTRQADIASGGHLHRIMVAVPPAPSPARGWPVLYVLDGDLMFAFAAQLMRNRFARGPGVPAQGAVVVGLGYAGSQVLDLAARTLDYTPPAPGPDHDERGRREGGADAFLDFVDGTVRPMVADAAHIDATSQTLFGHSYGGLCVLHALFTRPGGFRNYVAASPSAWWRDGFILEEQKRFLAARRAGAGMPPLRLLITQGEREAGPPADPARFAIARERRGGDRLRTLVAGLDGAPGLDLRFAMIPGADHGGAMAPAVRQALELAVGRP